MLLFIMAFLRLNMFDVLFHYGFPSVEHDWCFVSLWLSFSGTCLMFCFIMAFLQWNMFDVLFHYDFPSADVFDVLFHSGFPSAERPVQPLLGMGPRGWRVLRAHEESPAAGTVTIFGSNMVRIFFRPLLPLTDINMLGPCAFLALNVDLFWWACLTCFWQVAWMLNVDIDVDFGLPFLFLSLVETWVRFYTRVLNVFWLATFTLI